MDRRTFLSSLSLCITSALGTTLVNSCKRQEQTATTHITSSAHKLGHKLKTGNLPLPEREGETYDTIVIGSGVAGLSAARYLRKQGIDNVAIIEVNHHIGGNASSGKRNTYRYPYGAHYLPIAELHNKELIEFLSEHNIITGFENELPVYNENDLCFAPQERLYYRGKWRDGIASTIAKFSPAGYNKFVQLLHNYENLKNDNGEYIFALPICNGYTNDISLELDGISFADFLKNNLITEDEVIWYADYCCRDEYGMGIESISAFAGIQYFVARRAKSANAPEGTNLTWPNGNGHLVDILRTDVTQNLICDTLAYNIEIHNAKVKVAVINDSNNSKILHAKQCIIATPQFITTRLLSTIQPERTQWTQNFKYAPWLVVTLILNDTSGILSDVHWDNVLYGANSLGYINDTQQLLTTHNNKTVITWYTTLHKQAPQEGRKQLLHSTTEEIVNQVAQELESVHPGIISETEYVDAVLWGHGMIAPVVGFYANTHLEKLKAPIDNKIFFAHSDLSGLSLFEEAFYQGNRAAKELLQTRKHV